MKRVILIFLFQLFVNISFSQVQSFYNAEYVKNEINFGQINNLSYKPKINYFTKSIVAVSPIIATTAIYYNNQNPINTPYNILNRTLISGALFTTTLATGFWLSNSEKPYNTLLFTTHKLSTLSNIALLDYTAWQKHKHFSLTNAEKITSIVMNICFVSTIATGGMLSTNKTMPKFVHTLHKTTPWITIVSSSLLLYLLNK
ncbi:MAG: hypothetical protein IPM52_04390 [Bacteroidetes bacterium]|nr:hypothetical protein [Bacteroidota bacterium]